MIHVAGTFYVKPCFYPPNVDAKIFVNGQPITSYDEANYHVDDMFKATSHNYRLTGTIVKLPRASEVVVLGSLIAPHDKIINNSLGGILIDPTDACTVSIKISDSQLFEMPWRVYKAALEIIRSEETNLQEVFNYINAAMVNSKS